MNEALQRVRRLRFAVVVTLSLALLGLPCGPLAEALALDLDHAVAPASAALLGHSDPDSTHHANEHQNSCCTDCSMWLTAMTKDGDPAVIRTNNSFASYVLQNALVRTPSSNDGPPRTYRFASPPSLVSADTSLYSKTQRYRI